MNSPILEVDIKLPGLFKNVEQLVNVIRARSIKQQFV
jgi:hypothetical protein